MKKRTQAPENVTRIRNRYFAARDNGRTHDEAVAYANEFSPDRTPGKIAGPTSEQKKAIAGEAGVEIPEGWETLHYQKRLKIAKAIDTAFEPVADDKSGSVNRFIESEIARRSDVQS